MSKTTYERRKIQGICVRCGKTPSVAGKVFCTECAEKSRNYNQESRLYFKKLGFCPRCKRNKLFGDEKECPECIAMMYEVNRKSKEKGNVSTKEYYRNYNERLKEQGLCRGCRKRNIAVGHIYCSICLAKKRIRARKNNGIERNERYKYGICYRCGKQELVQGKKLCQKCYEDSLKSLQKANESESLKNTRIHKMLN